MNEFEATIHSLGTWSVSNLPGVVEIRIIADEAVKTAHMELCLRNDSWQARDRAIDAMLDVQEMFFDDVVITYTFGETRGDDLARAEGKSAQTFAAANA